MKEHEIMNQESDSQQKKDERFMRMALVEAMEAAGKGEIPVGAVITANDRVIARGHNLTETLHDVTAHAEMMAITAAEEYLGGKYLPDCTLYVTVEPCVMCAGALGWSQIGRIVFGASDPKRGYFSWLRPDRQAIHPKTRVTSGVLEEECKELMQDFFRKLRGK